MSYQEKISTKNDKAEMIWRRRDLVMRDEEEMAAKKKSIQPKLEISQAGDIHEQQGDLVANKVSSGQDASSVLKQQHTSVPSMQSRSEGESLQGSEALQRSLDSSKGSGQSLPEHVQQDIGGKMGADLSGVKIHTGSQAHEMSEGINAKAFTHGQNIYFKDGNYNPSTPEGKNLLAHELTHTVQQGEGKLQLKIQRQYYPNPNPVKSVEAPYVQPEDQTYKGRDNYPDEYSQPYKNPANGKVTFYRNRYLSEDTYYLDMRHDERPPVKHGKAFVYRRDIYIDLKDGRTIHIEQDVETFVDGNKVTADTKGYTVYSNKIEISDGQGNSVKNKNDFRQAAISLNETLPLAAMQSKIPAELLQNGPVDDAYIALAKKYADSVLPPSVANAGKGSNNQKSANDTITSWGQDSLRSGKSDTLSPQEKDWDKMSKNEKETLAWKEIWDKVSVGDMVLPVVIGIIIGIVLLIAAIYEAPLIAVGVLVLALVMLIIGLISDYSAARDDEERAYVIIRYAIYILGAIAGIIAVYFAPAMLLVIGIITIVASIIVGLIFLLRRVKRATESESREEFEKETDEGANIVENALVDVILFILTSLIPKLGPVIKPKTGSPGKNIPNPFRDWINPLEHKPLIPPTDPELHPQMEKGGGKATCQKATKAVVPKKTPVVSIQESAGMVGGHVEYSNGQKIEFLANKTYKGETVEYTDIIFYPENTPGNEMKNQFGPRQMIETIKLLKEHAKYQGFKKVRIQYERAKNSSSINPGHGFDQTFDL